MILAFWASIACGSADGAATRDEGQRGARLVVRHATVLDTRARRTLPDRAIVMQGDRILQVVPDSALDSLRGASVLMTSWARSSPDAPDFFPSGGALVSREDGRTPYLGHVVVNDSADAAARVRRYHAAGLRDIKLYWRLREPEYVGALVEARRLGMRVLEHFNVLGPRDVRMRRLIDEVGRSGATVTPTLHIFAQRASVAPYTTPSLGTFDRSEAWTPAQRARARRGYEILAGYVRQLHEAGVPLAVGTDWMDPGRAVLSEVILLERAGIPMADVLAIATLGGARVMERDAEYGTIEPGRKANLVIFDRNPIGDPEAVLAGKTVIKDGVVVRPR